MASSQHQYRLEKVRKLFGRHQIALDGIDLSVRRGEKVALIPAAQPGSAA
jgi:ABC-type sugar transport system ATPase subunit